MYNYFNTSLITSLISIFDTIVDLIIFIILLLILLYALISFFLYKIGKKYNIQSTFSPYVLPFYRYYLIIQLIGCNSWLLLAISAYEVGLVLSILFKGAMLPIFILSYIITSISMGYLWGKTGESMGKSCILWSIIGAICAFLIIPALVPYAIFALSEMRPISGLNPKNLKSCDNTSLQIKDHIPSANDNVVRYLYGLSGIYKGQTIPITSSIVIGRDPTKSSLILDTLGVSRKHANLTIDNGSILLEDLSSSNGTYCIIDGSTTKLTGKINLKIGDIFFIATKENMFEVR